MVAAVRHCSALALAGPMLLATAAPAQGTPAAAAATQAVILIVGDSLSAEYGLARGTGWVNLLTQRLAVHEQAAWMLRSLLEE